MTVHRGSMVLGMAACFALAACGSGTRGSGVGDGGSGGVDGQGLLPDPCAVAGADPRCGTACQVHDDCGPDLYCGADGRCRADCTPDGGECGPGRVCQAHGMCADDCPSVAVELAPVIPTVVLLIDQSSSMTTSFGGRSRWEAMKVALIDPTTGVLPALEDQVRFGASLYTSHNGTLDGESCPLLESIAPELHNSAAIAALLAANEPDGDTPTGESIDQVVADLEALPADPDSHEGPRVIVLATDGEPDTCAVPNPQTGQDRALKGAQNAYDAGIRTFILSVGSQVGAAHLQDMANVGAGLPVGGGTNAPYYVANDTTQLIAAFNDIIRGVRTCTFALDGQVQAEDAPLGDVRLDGTPLPYEDPNGWRLDDSSTLELLGDACAAFLENDEVVLSATFPCGTVIY